MYDGERMVYEHHLHGSRNAIRNRAKNLAIDYAIMALKKQHDMK